MINANGYQWRFVNTKQNHTKPTSVGSETFEFLMSSACLRITKGRRFISSLRPLLLFHPQHAFQLVHIVLSELFILHDLSSQVVSDQKKPTPSPTMSPTNCRRQRMFLGAKQSETTIKNAASGCWMMLGCWDVDACYNMLQCWVKQQAPKLLSYLRSSSWPIRQLQALRPQKTLGRIPWYPHL